MSRLPKLGALMSVVSAMLLAFMLPPAPTWAADNASRFAVSGKAKVHYLDFGTGDRAVMFVHGWACDSQFWKMQYPAFEKRTRLLAVDLPGHGKSDAPDIAYTARMFADGVEAVARHAGVTRMVLVVQGMALGVGLELIRETPALIAGIVVIDGSYFPDEDSDPETHDMMKDWHTAFVEALKGPGREGAITEFLETLFDPMTPEPLRDWISARIKATNPRVARSAMAHFIDTRTWMENPFDGPALAIYAISPDLPPNNAEVLSGWFADMRYVEWADVSHFVMLEKPKLVNGLIDSFLDDLKW